jgi:hypothetical protein
MFLEDENVCGRDPLPPAILNKEGFNSWNHTGGLGAG